MRGSDCSARNALQPQRGARSVVACRALRPRPLGPRGRRLGQARSFAGSHLRSPAGPPSPLRPCPTSSAPPTPPPSAAPLVLRRPRHRRRRGPVVRYPLRLRWSRPRRRPPIALAGPCPPRPRCGRTPTAPRSRPSHFWRARMRLTPRRGCAFVGSTGDAGTDEGPAARPRAPDVATGIAAAVRPQRS